MSAKPPTIINLYYYGKPHAGSSSDLARAIQAEMKAMERREWASEQDTPPPPSSHHPRVNGNPEDFVDIGSECFSDGEGNVISWKGENFYRACGYPVVRNSDGSGSGCVKRANHHGIDHEDYDGLVRYEED